MIYLLVGILSNLLFFRNGSHGPPVPLQKLLIGKREVVGFGINGEANYMDNVMAPFPAIRFANNTEKSLITQF